jgi:TM2 domain-containing membrane protein YozV
MLATLLLVHASLLYGTEKTEIITGMEVVVYAENSFYGHMLLHDVHTYGIPIYEPYKGNQGVPQRKDPFIAGLLSLFMMGVGQIYVHEYWKGSLFIAANFTNKILLILLINHINTKYGSADESVNVNWNSFEPITKVLIIGYLVESLGLRIFSVVDAVYSTQRYNERYTDTRNEKGYTLDIDGNNVSLGYYLRFNE